MFYMCGNWSNEKVKYLMFCGELDFRDASQKKAG